MSLVRSDGEPSMSGVVLWSFVVITLIVIGGMVIHFFFYEPYQQQGFNGQVQSLVTEFCSAPREADQQAVRIQLRGLTDGNPSRFSLLPQALRQDAQSVIDNDRQGVCS